MTAITEEEKAAKAAAKAEADAAKADAKEAAAAAKAAAKKEVSSVVFTRKDGTTREFTPDIHGDDFVAIADEFGETNATTIQSREDK